MKILELLLYEDDDQEQQAVQNPGAPPEVGSFMANAQPNMGYKGLQPQTPDNDNPTVQQMMGQPPTRAQRASAQTAVPSVANIPPPRGVQMGGPPRV